MVELSNIEKILVLLHFVLGYAFFKVVTGNRGKVTISGQKAGNSSHTE